jgi:hypothetical protein
MPKRLLSWLTAILVAIAVIYFPSFWTAPPPPSLAKLLTIDLARGPLKVYNFPANRPNPIAIILFGSGDGGWGGLENAIAHAFQSQGYTMLGVDCEDYAQTDYTLDTLQSDYGIMAKVAEAPYGNHPPPLIIGGYSMGAAQAIAAAGGPQPPPGLIGVLLVDPCSRGRYGLRSSDQMNVLPTGPGTFGVDSFANSMSRLHVVQWHASEDDIDSRAWLDVLTAPHQAFVFPNNGHQYEVHREEFVQQLVESATWILNPAPNGSVTAK